MSKLKRVHPLHTIGISDHAVVRYLERVHGINIKALKRHIMNGYAMEMVSHGAGRINMGTHVLVADGPTIVTVLKKDQNAVR